MKKQGFTLIELLAVIAILAILVILAVPKVLQLFEEAKKNTFKIEAQNIVKAAEQGYAKELFKGSVTETTIMFIDGEEIKTGNIPLNISGKKIENGKITITTRGKVSIAIHNEKYCATKEENSKNIVIEEKSKEECVEVEVTPEECFITDLSLAQEFTQQATEMYGSSLEFYKYGVVPLSQITEDVAVIYYYNYDNLNCPSNVIIPSTIRGKEIVGIGIAAFSVVDDDWGIVGMNITSIALPETVKVIGTYAFNSNLLTSINLSNVFVIGDFAFISNLLTDIVLPANMLYLGRASFNDNKMSDQNAFIYARDTEEAENRTIVASYAGEKRSNVFIPEGVKQLEFSSFANVGLTSVNLPSTLEYIGDSAFQSNMLESISIPNNVTTIEMKAFRFNNLSSITFSSNLSTIKYETFRGNNLTSIEIPNNITQIDMRAFSDNFILDGNATIDNFSDSVTVDPSAFDYNGPDGETSINPRFLRD